jgi:hypothetical protein
MGCSCGKHLTEYEAEVLVKSYYDRFTKFRNFMDQMDNNRTKMWDFVVKCLQDYSADEYTFELFFNYFPEIELSIGLNHTQHEFKMRLARHIHATEIMRKNLRNL